MGLKKRLLSVFVLLSLLVGMTTYAEYRNTVAPEEVPRAAFTAKDTLYFWYADAALTGYLERMENQVSE